MFPRSVCTPQSNRPLGSAVLRPRASRLYQWTRVRVTGFVRLPRASRCAVSRVSGPSHWPWVHMSRSLALRVTGSRVEYHGGLACVVRASRVNLFGGEAGLSRPVLQENAAGMRRVFMSRVDRRRGHDWGILIFLDRRLLCRVPLVGSPRKRAQYGGFLALSTRRGGARGWGLPPLLGTESAWHSLPLLQYTF